MLLLPLQFPQQGLGYALAFNGADLLLMALP